MKPFAGSLSLLFAFVFALGACSPATSTGRDPAGPPAPNQPTLSSDGLATATTFHTQTPAGPQPTPTPLSAGPDLNDFPPGYNPLTGQPMPDPATANLPAMLISISNFPAEARPQAGLSFADYVFEFSITEGATRFLSVFYGGFPQPEIPLTGDCEIRMLPFVQTGKILLGNRVWLDSNENGAQDFGEPGVGGVCVNLYGPDGGIVNQTTTDSNGYYGFNIASPQEAGARPYVIEVVQPSGMLFTKFKAANDATDSDVDPPSGRMEVHASSTRLDLDAGLFRVPGPTPTPDPARKPPRPEVGPVRSGRLIYADFANMFQDSCLVYAFASEEVLAQIPTCSMVVHEVGGGGAMLPLDRMRAIAEDNRKADTQFNYSSNLYTDLPPIGGSAGTRLDVYFALLNQSGWTYDPLMQSYLHFRDESKKETAGQLQADTDRLTSRQLHFENIIVLMTDHVVVSPTNLDIDLAQGGKGYAYLFRDGLEYPIQWSTLSGEYEKKTGFRRPIQWLNPDGSLFPLKPGHTWVIIVTPFSSLTDAGGGAWKLRFYPPEGSQ